MFNVMIVDDSLVIRKNLKKYFEKLGCEVVAEAVNGKQAIFMAKEYRPDIITLDITMPEVDGIEALEKILKINNSVEVIMISAISTKRNVLKSLTLGAKHFLTKPITFEKVKNIFLKIKSKKITEEKEKIIESIDDNLTEEIDLKEENSNFRIINNNGVFIIKIEKMNIVDLEKKLNEALITFKLISPLKIRIDLEGSIKDNDSIGLKVMKFCKKIENNGGEIIYNE